MPKQRSLFIRLVASAFALAVLVVQPQTAISQNSPNQTPEIKVDNFTFTPETLTVPVNSTVTWTNKDDVPHVIASNDGLFRSKGIDTDDHFSYKFTKPGTYNYFCSIHPKMTGKIVVQ